MSCWGELGFPGIFAAEDFIHRPPFHYIFICRHPLEQIWVEIAERQGRNFCCILSSARAYLVLCYFGASLIKISIKWIEKYMRVVYTHMCLFVCANMCGGQCSVVFFFFFDTISFVRFYQQTAESHILRRKPACAERCRKHPADLSPQRTS